MKRVALIVLRPMLLLLLVLWVTALLVRVAPGYFVDERELDMRGGAAAFQAVKQIEVRGPRLASETLAPVIALLRGRLGESRLYHVPVASLIGPRWAVTLRLMVGGLAVGWCAALLLALPVALASRRSVEAGLVLPTAVLLALPSGVLATLCVVSGRGGPVLVIAAVCAPRIFKYLLRLLRTQLEAPHLLHTRACGLSTTRILAAHVWPAAAPEMLALFATSVMLALSAVVPIEVVFDLPGIGQLAWTAAMNRDQPVLLATSLLAAGAVVFASMLADVPVERLA